MKKISPALIGFLQAIGVIAYCVLLAVTFNFLGKNMIQPPEIIGFAAMLVVLVFSAAITGLIVFGYPAYLFLKQQKVKEPLLVLAFTGVFCLLILMIAVVVYFLVVS